MPSKRSGPSKCLNHSQGFTLVEVMLALLVLSLLAALSWQGLSTLMRTRSLVQSHIDTAQVRDGSLAQWRIDWQQLWTEPLGVRLPAHEWDGQHLVLLRRAPFQSQWEDAGIQVVAWVVRDGHWWRWASAPTRQQAELTQAWQHAQLWVQQGQASPLAHALTPAMSWQVFYHRGGAWVNPASDATSAQKDPALLLQTSAPDAIRLSLNVADQQTLTLDIASPTLALERP